MDNPKLVQLLDNLVGKRFEHKGAKFNCIDWNDLKAANKIEIITNGEALQMKYADVQSFFREIKIIELPAPEEEPFLPAMIHELFNRQDQEAADMTKILLKVAAEFAEGKPVTQNTIDRGKTVAQLAQAMTNQHKAQTSGIAEVGKLFKLKAKSKKQIGNNSSNSDEEKPE